MKKYEFIIRTYEKEVFESTLANDDNALGDRLSEDFGANSFRIVSIFPVEITEQNSKKVVFKAVFEREIDTQDE